MSSGKHTHKKSFVPFLRMLFRTTPTPSTALALGARSVGHYRVAPDFCEKPTVKHFVQIFWGITGMGILTINRREQRLRPGQIAVYFPGHCHIIRAGGEAWEYRWWTMDGLLAEPIAAAFGLAPGIFEAGPAPLALFKALERTIVDPTPRGEKLASACAYELLARAAGGARVVSGTVEACLAEIHAHWKNPLFGVKVMASRIGIHRSRLSRLFRQATGLSPLEYLLRLRLQKAMSLLRQTDMAIADIAAACGFADSNYFSRFIRRKLKMSPRLFRHEA